MQNTPSKSSHSRSQRRNGEKRKWKEKTAKCGEGSNHLLAPVGRPARLPANFSSHVSCSGTSPRWPWPDQSDETLEWASNSYFLNERTQTEKKTPSLSIFCETKGRYGADKTVAVACVTKRNICNVEVHYDDQKR